MKTAGVEELINRILEGIPAFDARLAKEDFEHNLRAAVQAGLRKMNLVSRDELEIQQAVLKRTREKLENLEKLVSELEAKINARS